MSSDYRDSALVVMSASHVSPASPIFFFVHAHESRWQLLAVDWSCHGARWDAVVIVIASDVREAVDYHLFLPSLFLVLPAIRDAAWRQPTAAGRSLNLRAGQRAHWWLRTEAVRRTRPRRSRRASCRDVLRRCHTCSSGLCGLLRMQFRFGGLWQNMACCFPQVRQMDTVLRATLRGAAHRPQVLAATVLACLALDSETAAFAWSLLSTIATTLLSRCSADSESRVPSLVQTGLAPPFHLLNREFVASNALWSSRQTQFQKSHLQVQVSFFLSSRWKISGFWYFSRLLWMEIMRYLFLFQSQLQEITHLLTSNLI